MKTKNLNPRRKFNFSAPTADNDRKNYRVCLDEQGQRRAPKYLRDEQDPFWYAMDEQAIKNMGSLPWNDVATAPILERVGVDQSEDRVSRDRLPGLMTIDYYPVVGSFESSAIDNSADTSANAFFTYMTQGFTSNIEDFEPADLLFTAIAGHNLIATMMHLKRVYGVMQYYLMLNPFYARKLVQALGMDYDDLAKNMANFRTEYNLLVSRINKILAVPIEMTIGTRWEYLNSFIFTDTSEPDYSTAIAFRPMKGLIYDPITATTGTCLRWIDFPTTGEYWTHSRWFGIVGGMLSRLEDSDVRNMFGALKRVYNDSQLITLTPLDENYVTPIVQNDIVMTQIHNCDWFSTNHGYSIIGPLEPNRTTANTWRTDVVASQQNGRIITPIYVKADNMQRNAALNNESIERNTIIDMYDHEVSAANVLDVTALKCPIDSSLITIETDTYYHANCRGEIISGITVYYTDDTNSLAFNSVNSFHDINNPYDIDFVTLAFLSHVDSHPLIPFYRDVYNTNQESIPVVDLYYGEIDRYTTVSKRSLSVLNRRCLWRMLLLPASQKSVTG